MSHELDKNQRTGQHTVFSVIQSMWHRLGHVLKDAPTLEVAASLAGWDYEVTKRQAFFRKTDGSFIPVGKHRILVRNDRETVLGTCSEQYKVIQNMEAFDILRPLLDRGVATLETGGTLREGRDAWAQVKLNIDDPIVQEVFNTEVESYILVHTNHGGDRPCVAKETPQRVVCANTLRAAMGQGVNVQVAHRGQARIKLVEAAEQLLAKLTERYIGIAQDYKAMKETILTVEQFTASILDPIAPMPVPNSDGTLPRGFDKKLARRALIASLWERGMGHTGNHSAWEAYNAVTEALAHDDLFRPRGGHYLESAIDGTLDDLNQMALVGALSLSK